MFLMEYTLKNLRHQQGDFEGFLVKCSKAMSSIFRHEGQNEVDSQAWMTFQDFSLKFMQVCLSDDILLDPPFATPQKRWEKYQTSRYPLQPCDFFCMLLFNSKGRFEWDLHYTEPTTRQGWSRRQMEDRLNQSACRWCVRIRACQGHSFMGFNPADLYTSSIKSEEVESLEPIIHGTFASCWNNNIKETGLIPGGLNSSGSRLAVHFLAIGGAVRKTSGTAV